MFKECLGKNKRDINFRCSFINGMYMVYGICVYLYKNFRCMGKRKNSYD